MSSRLRIALGIPRLSGLALTGGLSLVLVAGAGGCDKLGAQHAAAPGAGAAGNEIEADAANLAVGRHLGVREDADLATHAAPPSSRSIT